MSDDKPSVNHHGGAPLASLRRLIAWVQATRARGGAEANLLLLAVVGLVLFCALVGTLFGVQSSLVGSQTRLAEVTLPATQALGQLESSIGAMFQRQAQVSSTQTTEQLTPFRDRGPLVASLRAQVTELSSRVAAAEAHPDDATRRSEAALAAHAEEFLDGDAVLLSIVSRRHELAARFEKELAGIDADLRQVIEGAQSTAGLLQLEFVLRLRRVAANLGNARDVREIVLGSSRAQLDDVNQLVQGILSMGWLAGKVGLAQSSDTLNSISGNELTQARAKVRGLIVQLKMRAAPGSDVRARIDAFEAKFEDTSSRLAEDKGERKSLVSLRREVLQQVAQAASVREKSLATAQALTADVAAVRGAVTLAALGSLSASTTTSWVSRLASILVALLGLGGCLFAGQRIGRSVQDLRSTNHELVELRDSLQRINHNLEDIVAQRTQALTKRDRAMQLVLDSMREGLLSTDLEGHLLRERSKVVSAWFGDIGEQPVLVWDYLFTEDEAARNEFRRQYSQVAEDIIPFELTSSQLPHRLIRGGRSFDLEFLQVFEDERFSGVLTVISDVTAQLEALRAERAAREEQEMITAFLRDRRGFARGIRECETLLETFATTDDPVVGRRALHTLKGSAAVLGLSRLSAACQEMENRLDADALATRADAQDLHAQWRAGVTALSALIGNAAPKVEVDEAEIVAVADGLRAGQDRAELEAKVTSWRLATTEGPLARLAAQAARLAEKLGKSIDVDVAHNGTRVPPDVLDDFWANLVHAVRNAVDHGIEVPDERTAAGKSPAGRLRLATGYDAEDNLVVEVSDDGRGVDFDRLRVAAQQRGMAHRTESDLIEAMFADGLTTATQVTDLSGRGVGASALRQACRQLGGTVRVETARRVGTRFMFLFPAQALWSRDDPRPAGALASAGLSPDAFLPGGTGRPRTSNLGGSSK